MATGHPCPPFLPASRATSGYIQNRAILDPSDYFVLFLFWGILTMLRLNMCCIILLQENVVFGMVFMGVGLLYSLS